MTRQAGLGRDFGLPPLRPFAALLLAFLADLMEPSATAAGFLRFGMRSLRHTQRQCDASLGQQSDKVWRGGVAHDAERLLLGTSLAVPLAPC